MGTFQHTIEVGTAEGGRFIEVRAWVDSGANYSQLPSSMLRDLGFTPTFTRRFRLADGRVIERGLCWLPVRLNGEVQPTPCVFGNEGSEALLGAMALEMFSLGIDRVNKTLVPVEARALLARNPGRHSARMVRQAHHERITRFPFVLSLSKDDAKDC